MKIKHYSVFKNDMKVLHWESLRNSEIEKPYYLPYSKDEYFQKVEVIKPSLLSEIIFQELKKTDLKNIFSIGSGIAYLEYQLKKFSNLNVVVSDYNSSINRLKDFGVFDDALQLDALEDPIPIDESWVVLLPRIDTEFDDYKLAKLFEKCSGYGIRKIFFIPAELLSFRIIVAEIKGFFVSIVKRKPRVFCGYARSMKSFTKLWNPYYKLLKVYKLDTPVFSLQLREKL